MALEPRTVQCIPARLSRVPMATLQDRTCENWRRGWDSNPRMEVLQTSPLGHLGTAPNLKV